MTLLFKKKYIPQIINGQKTATRRKTRPMVKIGGTYKLRTDYTTYIPELIQVTRLYQQKLGEITQQDTQKEGYKTLQQFKETWKTIYKTWNPTQQIWTVEFKYIGTIRA